MTTNMDSSRLQQTKNNNVKPPMGMYLIIFGVSVFYNPENVNESLLDVKVGFSTVSLLFFGILSFVLFIFMVWKGYIEPR